jgi:predicted homoserine dehydrogenase-like protein
MIRRSLQELEGRKEPIRVGIVGAGDFGGTMVCQISQMRGIEVPIVGDIDVERAKNVYLSSGVDERDMVVADSISKARSALERGKKVIAEDGLIVTECPLDVVVDATGEPRAGALIAYNSILNGKHMVTVNVEADVVVGPMLGRLAESAGLVYAVVDGDQPGSIMTMYDWAVGLGFEVAAAGKGTRLYPEFANREEPSKQVVEYLDGSKSQIEMASVANMTGLIPDVRGMHKPSAKLADVPKIFSLKEDGGILENKGVVDFINCMSQDGKTLVEPLLADGIFLVVACGHPRTLEVMARKGVVMGAGGKNGLLYRPFHLVGVEAPMTIVNAALFGMAAGTPMRSLIVDIVTVAKRRIRAGEIIGGLGSDSVRGEIERRGVAKKENLLPIGLSERAMAKVDIEEGTAITYDMVEPDRDSFLFKLRELQNASEQTSNPNY